MKLIEKARKDLTRVSFLLSVSCMFIMIVIVALGNPKSGAFFYHYVPEMLGIYCFGIWARQVGFSLRVVLLLSAFVAVIMPILMGNFLWIPITIWLAVAFPLGYIVERSNEKLKNKNVLR